MIDSSPVSGYIQDIYRRRDVFKGRRKYKKR